MSLIESPCTGVCTLDAANVCLGCGRHIDEIAAWGSASEPRRREIVAKAAARRAATPSTSAEPNRTP